MPEARADAEGAVALLERLVAIPSPPRREAAAVAALVEWMSARGFAAAPDEAGSAVGTRGEGPREVVLLGHIDTFPGLVPIRREGSLLFGRGTVDAKGPLCAFAAAAAAVVPAPGWRIRVVGAVEEESWTSRGARHLVTSWGDRPPPAAMIVGEPSRWDRVTLGYRGSVELRLRLRVPFAHSAGQAALPAERAVELWEEVRSFCEAANAGRPNGEFERCGAALRSIRTGDDGAWGEAMLSIGVRLPPGMRLATLRRELRAALVGRVASWADASLGIRFRGGQEAWRASRATPVVSAFLRAIRAQGGDPRFVVKTGTADLTIVGPAWPDTPMAVYGPGDGALDHTPGEHVDLGEYLRAIEVLTAVLRDLTRSPGEPGEGAPPARPLQPFPRVPRRTGG